MRAPLSAAQLETARALTRIFAGEQLALVGAAALGCWLPLRAKTEDVDFVVAVGIESVARLRGVPGWKRHAKREHEWTSPNGEVVDVLPASQDLLKARRLVWPESKHEMNLTAIRLVFDHARCEVVADELTLLVPPVPVLAVLKMIAYLDRHARESKDLVHLAVVLDEYPPTEDERMFTQEHARAGFTPDEARAQVLGREISGMVDAHERAECLRFIRAMRDDTTHAARFVRVMIQPTDDREDLLSRRLEILAREIELRGNPA